ncbi:N-methyl-L-tryptophan oxidase [Urbifossiella limnaea]|uniref:Monomeric sarcosine oxidase n=1 Tax=Urbifossiella limnaea TaxID=2528023 RepID=A0A517XNL7_9BACT|nr:N-methyl-L-tryptophan oxidase [Urbifossiella limnaea]QDU19104.1 Monomeric sarcosine oxidase [Urbifossiella limnaea]
MATTCDVIVIGVGGMGSAACFELSRRGAGVVGLEQFPLAHSRGSSHGRTRIIRTAYYEHPDYVPLLRRAWERWYELEQLTGRHLLTGCPCLMVGPESGEVVTGVRAAAREHDLAVESLTAAEVNRRFPFRFPDDYAGVLEHAAGFLAVEDCVRAHADAARHFGADLRAEEAVRSWAARGDGVEVVTDRDTYHAARLVVTAGAWATQLLADLGVPLTVMRQVMTWFRTDSAAVRRDRFPIFLADVPGGAFYGLPAIDADGVKVARHYGAPELRDPTEMNWQTTPADFEPVDGFLRAYSTLPPFEPSRAEACLYTLTPDRHFVIDTHLHYPQVSVACGFSGHGFKFAPVVGEVLADLALTGRTPHPIGRFAARGR